MALASDLTTTSLTGFAVLVAALGFTSPPALAGLQILTPRALRGRTSAAFVASVTLVAFGVGPALVGVINDRVVGPEHVGAAMLAVFSATALVGIRPGSLDAHPAFAPIRRTCPRGIGARLKTAAETSGVGCARRRRQP